MAAQPGDLLYYLSAGHNEEFVFEGPSKLNIAPDGIICITAANGIYLYSPEGTLVRSVEVPGGFINADVDARGYIYAVDYSFLSVFDASGTPVFSTYVGVTIQDVAVDAVGYVYVLASNFSAPTIEIYDPAWSHVRTIDLSRSYDYPQQFSGMALFGDSIYLSDTRHSITVYSTGGELLAQYGGLNTPYDVNVDVYGYLYGADTFGGRVAIFDGAGNLASEISSLPEGYGPFGGPTGVAAADDGTVYVADGHRILVFSKQPDGYRFEAEWARDGSFYMEYPMGVDFDAGGNVYVASLMGRIFVFDSAGRFLRSWAPVAEGQALMPNLIAVDPEGRVYLPGNYQIPDCPGCTAPGAFVFDNYGQYLHFSGLYAPDPYGYQVGFGIDVDPMGSIFSTTNSGFVLTPWSAWPTGGEWPCIINADGSNVFVSYDSFSEPSILAINSFDYQGNFRFSIDEQSVGLPGFQPHGQALDGMGNLYVADMYQPFIAVVSAQSGGLSSWFGLQTGIPAMLVAVDKCGSKIYTSSFAQEGIAVYQGPGSDEVFLAPYWTGGLQTSPEGGSAELWAGMNTRYPCGEITSYQWTWEGGSAEGAYAQVFMSPGQHQVTLTVETSTGKTADTAMTVTVADPHKPVSTVYVAGGEFSQGYYVTDVGLRVVAEDVGTGVREIRYTADGSSGVTTESSILFTFTEEGEHTLRCQAVDWAGNQETEHGTMIRLDKSGPQIAYDVAGDMGAGDVYLSDVTVTISAVDPQSPVRWLEYSVNDGPPQRVTPSGGSFTLADNGSYDIRLSAQNWPNLSSTETFSIVIDTSPPETAASIAGTPGGGGWYVTPVTVTLTAAAAGSSIREIRYAVNAGEETAVPGDTTEIALGDGVHELLYYAVNALGRAENPKVISLKVDASAPAIEITGVEEGAVYELGSVPGPAYEAGDELSGLASSSDSLSGGDEFGLGAFSYTVTAMDRAGNLGQETVTYEVIATIEGMSALIDQVVMSGGIDAGDTDALLRGLLIAQDAYDRGSESAGDHRLEALMNYIQAQTGKRIGEGEADLLLHALDYIITH